MLKTVIWVAVGLVALVIIGKVVTSILSGLLGFAFYLVVGAVVVGGVLYLLGRARGAIRGGRQRELP